MCCACACRALLEMQPVLLTPEAMAQAAGVEHHHGSNTSPTHTQQQQQLDSSIRSRTWCVAGAARRLVAVPAAAAGTGLEAVARAAAGHMLCLADACPSAAASWRCWYVPHLLEGPGAAAGGTGQPSWRGALHAALQQQAQAGQSSLVVQCVPVLAVQCDLVEGPCCCVVEALWPCVWSAPVGTSLAT
jgi:hypothetical protein